MLRKGAEYGPSRLAEPAETPPPQQSLRWSTYDHLTSKRLYHSQRLERKGDSRPRCMDRPANHERSSLQGQTHIHICQHRPVSRNTENTHCSNACGQPLSSRSDIMICQKNNMWVWVTRHALGVLRTKCPLNNGAIASHQQTELTVSVKTYLRNLDVQLLIPTVCYAIWWPRFQQI